ncbi:MAG: class I SAM-dependent methyltransferase [Bacteroidota bacterium]
MNKWKKALKAIGLILKNPWLLNKILDDTIWEDYVIKQYSIAKGFPVIKPEQLGLADPDTVYPYAFLDGGSLPTDLSLLNSLAQKIADCCYFEIGTWRGESVANVARFAKDCYTLDLTPEQLRLLGRDEAYIKAQAELSRHLKNVTHLLGDTKTFDFSKFHKNFNLIFIDGDHHYEMVKHDTEKVINHLYSENTIIVWHDYAINPEQVRFEVMAGILDGLPKKKYELLYHVEHTKCAILFPKNLKGKSLSFPMEIKDVYEVQLKKKALSS